NEDEAARVGAREWIFEPGLPANVPPARSLRFEQVDAQVAALEEGTAPRQLETEDWSTHEWLRFLRALPDSMSNADLRALDRAFGFTRSGNSEIAFAWFRIAVRNRYEPALPA